MSRFTQLFRREFTVLQSKEPTPDLEGLFHEINGGGKAVRQVCLGLTQTELVIARGVVGDDNEQGLELMRSLPLKLIQIVIADDRAKRLAVATCTGATWYYEMCSFQQADDRPWLVWKNAITALNSVKSQGGLGISRISVLRYGDTLPRKTNGSVFAKNQGLLNPATRSEEENPTLQYISYPFFCRDINDAGIQTGKRDVSSSNPPIAASTGSHVALPDALERVCFDLHPGSVLEVVSRSRLSLRRSKSCHHVNPVFSDAGPDEVGIGKPLRRWPSVLDLWSPRTDHIRAKYGSKDEQITENEDILKDGGFTYLGRQKQRHHDEQKILDKIALFRKKHLDKVKTCGRRANEFPIKNIRVFDDDSSDSDEHMVEGVVEVKHQKKARWKLFGKKKDKGKKQKRRQNLFPIARNVNPHQCHARSIEHSRSSKALDFYPEEIADQLTLMDMEQLWLLSEIDIVRLEMTSATSEYQISKDIAVLRRMADMAWRIPLLVATEILSQTTIDDRLKCLKFFNKVAQICWHTGNFNSFVNVMRGLKSYPVHSIQAVWKTLQREEPSVLRVFSQMCEAVAAVRDETNHSDLQPRSIPAKTPSIPWFPNLVSDLTNMARHQRYTKACHDDDDRSQENTNWNSRGSVRRASRAPPERISRYASALANAITRVAVERASQELNAGSSSNTEGPDSSVEEIDAESFFHTQAPRRKSVLEKVSGFFFESQSDEGDDEMEPKFPKGRKKRKSILENVVAFVKNEADSDEECDCRPSADSGNRKKSIIDKLVDFVKPDPNNQGESAGGTETSERRKSVIDKVMEILPLSMRGAIAKNGRSANGGHDETTEVSQSNSDAPKPKPKKSVRFLLTENEESENLDKPSGSGKRRKSVMDKVAEFFPISTNEPSDDNQPSNSSTRRKSVIDQVVDLTPFAHSQDKNGSHKGERRKSVFDSVVDIVTGEESTDHEEDGPDVKSKIPTLAKLDLIVEGEELEEFKHSLEEAERTRNSYTSDEKRPIFNKKRTPLPLRLVGRLVNKKEKSNKSTWGDLFEETEPEPPPAPSESCPTPEQLRRGSRRYSLGVVPTDDGRVRRLLSSIPGLPSWNSNHNAKGTRRFFWPQKQIKTRESFCEICLERCCRYDGDPGELLLEAHISAGKYDYKYNRAAARFLARRPLLSEHKLLEMIDHERLV